mgnify:CR=1 FL=1
MKFYSDIVTKKETIQTNLLVNMSTVLFMHFSLYYNIEMYASDKSICRLHTWKREVKRNGRENTGT